MITAALLANALAFADAADVADRQARSALIGEKFFSLQAGDILKKARALPAEKRYDMLARWVLPSEDHATFRLYGEPQPFDAAPPVASGLKDIDPKSPRAHSGGELEFPAFELVAAAKELKKLDDLGTRVEGVQAKSDHDKRNRLALLALVRIAQERDDDAIALLKQLLPLLKALPDDTPVWSRWPELAASLAAIGRPKLLPAAMGLLNEMVEQVQKKGQGERWDPRVRHARALAQVLTLPEAERTAFGTDPKSTQWRPVTPGRALTRGQGRPRPHWTIHNGETKHYPGHDRDFLYFQSPLRGNFEVSAELTSFGWREARITYAGAMVGVVYELKRYDLQHYGRFLPGGAIEPPLKDIKDYYPFRIAVKDGTYTVFAAGQKIYEQRLPDEPDPWLAIYVGDALTGGARNLKITGNPTIPESLTLSNLPDLTGWLADYYEEPVSGDQRTWEKRGEEIVGKMLLEEQPNSNQQFNPYKNERPTPRAIAGSKIESVLQYNRPLLEDGEIRYEFFYDPGKVLTHPALDRLVFALDPKGVNVHWLTDAQHDRTGLLPDNVTAEKSNRRGPEALPFKPKAWNAVKVSLAGDTVTLSLNDTVVYERPLEPTNQRVFGLFHYADETEVRVRNVVYKGDWPKKLPEVQELAGTAEKAAPAAKP